MIRRDITGKRFYRLVARSPREKRNNRQVVWEFKCDCGNTLVALGTNVVRGLTRSCGCLKAENRGSKHWRFKHGGKKNSKPEYESWMKMRARCNTPTNPKYYRYGARGIKVCKRWDSFAFFLKDMGKKPSSHHSIDRKDNDGNYTPTNCQWSTAETQSNNRSTTVFIEFKGKRLPFCVWSRRLGFSKGKVRQRLKAGWSVEKSFLTP